MVKIYTFSDKRPDFIFLQYEYFKRFLKDEQYEFIVCNNASSQILSTQIEKACAAIDIQCLAVDKDFTDPAIACAIPINSCIKRYIKNDATENLSVIIDSDIFLFSTFSFKTYLGRHDLAGIVQQRETRSLLRCKNLIYLWNALLVFDNSKIHFDDFDVSIIPGITDVGGGLSAYLKKWQPNIKWMKHTPDIEHDEKRIFKQPLRDIYEDDFGMQLIEDSFIHYYRGSNWDINPTEYHTKKTNFLKEFLLFSEHDFPLNTDSSESFNNIAAHCRKHYNGIRNNKNFSFSPKPNLLMDYVSQEYWDKSYEDLDIEFSDTDPVAELIKNVLNSTKLGVGDVLEIGCYPGRYLKIFGEFGFCLNGIDTTPKVTDLPQYFASKGYRTGSFIQADIFQFSIDRKFDIVCSFGFIEHFENWQDVVLFHLRLVKPGGLILITVPNFAGFLQKSFHTLFDIQNLKRHNLKSMVVEEWIKALKTIHFKYEILFDGPFGEIEFWVDEEKRSRLKRYALALVLRLLNGLRQLKLPPAESYSPYLGLVIKVK